MTHNRSMKCALVTGGTGFIGAYVVRRLLEEERGTWVRLLVRNPARVPEDIRGAVEVVPGDLLDRAAVRTAVEGADTVLHLAALARAWAPDPSSFHATNVGALSALLEEMDRAGVQRFVHVSTVMAGGPRGSGAANGANGSRTPSPYEISKREGEQLVLERTGSSAHAVIVRPTRVYGPGPLHDANGVTKMLHLYIKGQFRVRLDDGDVLGNYVHADDVARGVLLAARRGARGGVYTLGSENISLRGLLELASELSGVRRAVVPIPAWAGLAIGAVAELSGLVGATPFITRDWVRTFLEDWRVDIGPARRDLGYEPRTLRAGLAETIAWLRSPGAAPA